jgi:diguanylate cyclase (GGDEF)-like protein
VRPDALEALGADLRAAGWQLAAETVDDGLADDGIPALARLGRAAQLGELPTFVAELGRALRDPVGNRPRLTPELAAVARAHAQSREELGFGSRDVVTEFLLLRRVVWRYVAAQEGVAGLDLPDAARRVDDLLDRVIVECVGAYFDRATADLAEQTRRDPLTGLLNHQAFVEAVTAEVERSGRYDSGLTLVLFDVDRFSAVNEAVGHVEADRVLRRLAELAQSRMRRSDLGGRLGGDAFGALLLETGRHGGGRFLHRLRDGLADLRARGDVPEGFTVTAGCAHFAEDAASAEDLLRLADERHRAAKLELLEEPGQIGG